MVRSAAVAGGEQGEQGERETMAAVVPSAATVVPSAATVVSSTAVAPSATTFVPPQVAHQAEHEAYLARVHEYRRAQHEQQQEQQQQPEHNHVHARACADHPDERPLRVLIIDNYDSFTYNLAHLFDTTTATSTTSSARSSQLYATPLVVYNTLPAHILASLLPSIDAIVISPGPGHPSVNEDFGICADVLRGAFTRDDTQPSHTNTAAAPSDLQTSLADIPVFGVCLGLQGLMTTHGGAVVRAAETMHGRLAAIHHTRESIFADVPESPFIAVRYNSLVADRTTLPPSLHVTAWSETNEVMGLAHRTRPLHTVQFHPESICSQYGAHLVRAFARIVRAHPRYRAVRPVCTMPSPLVDARWLVAPSARSFLNDVDVIANVGSVDDVIRAADSAPSDSAPPSWRTRLDEWMRSSASPNGVRPDHLLIVPAPYVDSARVHMHVFQSRPNVVKDANAEASPSSSSPAFFWLDSSKVERSRSRFSYMGDANGPHAFTLSYSLDQRRAHLSSSTAAAPLDLSLDTEHSAASSSSDSLFSVLQHVLHEHCIQSRNRPATETPFEFEGGWVGYVSYEMRAECQPGEATRASTATTSLDRVQTSTRDAPTASLKGEPVTTLHGEPNPTANVPVSSPPSSSTSSSLLEAERAQKRVLPHAAFLFADRFLVFDHEQQQCYAVCLCTAAPTDRACAESWVATLVQQLKSLRESSLALPLAQASPLAHASPLVQPTFAWRHEPSAYLDRIDDCFRLIRDGESYELCLTNQLVTNAVCDPVVLYHTLRSINPAPFAAFLRFDPSIVQAAHPPHTRSSSSPLHILCSSPERFLKVGRDRWAEFKPIKGTAPRGATPAEDEAIRDALRRSAKDFAENLMIVDLIRNDMAKVCDLGSVRVPSLIAVETYSTLHTLVTTVRGRLPDRTIDASQLLQSTFPPGSMTGAPKIRSCALLAEIEAGPRGVYSGCIGFLSVNGCADMNVVIRTAVHTNECVSIGAGGAIVHLSQAKDEFAEIELKAKALVQAIRTTCVGVR